MTKPKITFETYKSRNGWRWRARHRNGHIIAESGEAYKSKWIMKRSLNNLIQVASDGDYEIQ